VCSLCNALSTDQQFNSCDVPEEEGSELSDSQEYVYATFTPGAIVWAKITGYPWCVSICFTCIIVVRVFI